MLQVRPRPWCAQCFVEPARLAIQFDAPTRQGMPLLAEGLMSPQVWYKHDLRLDDHPGLVSAARSSSAIVPLFCFDPVLHGDLLTVQQGLEGEAQYL